MPSRSDAHQEAAAILARAKALAASPLPEAEDADAEVLASLAGGMMSLAEADDETLERLVERFGTDALVRAVLAAPQATPSASDQNGPFVLPDASVVAPGPVVAMPARRTVLWSSRSTWMAAAASLILAAVTAVLLNAPSPGRSPSSEGGAAQSGGLVPRVQTPGSQPGSTTRGPLRGPSNRVAVLIRGNNREAAVRAESVLVKVLTGQQGLQALDAESLSLLRRQEDAVNAASGGDFTRLAAIGSEHGVALMIVGDLATRAVAENQTYRGVAELRTRMYGVSRQRAGEQTSVAGAGGAPAPSAPTEIDTEILAAEDVARQAAAVISSWLGGPQG